MTTATHDERLILLRSYLRACGYSDEGIAENFPIWLPGEDVIRPNYVAFTDPDQKDMSTSAIVAQVVEGHDDISNRWVPAANALAAPALVVALPDRLEIWSSGNELIDTREVTAASVSTFTTSRLRLLTPEVVSRAKAILQREPISCRYPSLGVFPSAGTKLSN